MQNLFLKLSQTLARLTGDGATITKLNLLQSRVASLEEKNAFLTVEAAKIEARVQGLEVALTEINAINNILLSVQQQIMEELIYPPPSTSKSKSGKKTSPLMIFPIGPVDDDDLPN